MRRMDTGFRIAKRRCEWTPESMIASLRDFFRRFADRLGQPTSLLQRDTPPVPDCARQGHSRLAKEAAVVQYRRHPCPWNEESILQVIQRIHMRDENLSSPQSRSETPEVSLSPRCADPRRRAMQSNSLGSVIRQSRERSRADSIEKTFDRRYGSETNPTARWAGSSAERRSPALDSRQAILWFLSGSDGVTVPQSPEGAHSRIRRFRRIFGSHRYLANDATPFNSMFYC